MYSIERNRKKAGPGRIAWALLACLGGGTLLPGMPGGLPGAPESQNSAPKSQTEGQASPFGPSVWEIPNWRPSPRTGTDQAPAPGPVAAEQSNPGRPKHPARNAGIAEDGLSIPILCYHQNFAAAENQNELNVPPAMFEEQLRTLRAADYTSVSLDDLYYYMAGEGRSGLPERPIVLTFDDGFKTNATLLATLLEKYDFTAVLFIDPSGLNASSNGALTGDEVKALLATGRFEIGSAGLGQPVLPRENDREIRRQLEQSRLQLQQELGVRVYDLAYPGGLYDRRVFNAAAEAGYRMALTINTGTARPGMELFALPRILVTNRMSLSVFSDSLRIHSPAEVRITPPDGSRVKVGTGFLLRIAGNDPAALEVRLGGEPLVLEPGSDPTFFRGILPDAPSPGGFLPLTIRGLIHGRPFFRQFLYIEEATRP